jgi:hypothetical protein
MKYMLLMYWNQSEVPEYTREEQQEVQRAWLDYNKEAKAAEVLVDTNGLAPAASATTVRVRDGKTLTTDGPFAETHEQMGGYYVMDCADLDEAIGWAAKIPAAQTGSIEIRPLWGQQ